MVKYLIILLSIPVICSGQPKRKKFKSDNYLLKAGNQALTGYVILGLTGLVTVTSAPTAEDNGPVIAALAGTGIIVSTAFFISAWGNIRKEGLKTSFYIKPNGVMITYNF